MTIIIFRDELMSRVRNRFWLMSQVLVLVLVSESGSGSGSG